MLIINENTKKLNVSDYAFEIDGRNIIKCYLTYSINKFEKFIHYVDGNNKKEYEDVISLEIKGIDLNTEKEAWFSFELKIGLDELNNFSEIPVNIIDKVYVGESFIKRPTFEHSTFLDFEFPTNTKDDMCLNLSSVWVSKLSDNKFIFKVCVPSEGLFCYFPISFDEK